MDDEAIRELFRKTLELGNCHVITAESGVEALKLMKSWSFDLVFLDLEMSGMDGVEALRQIRQLDNSVPIVIITGYPANKLMEKALEQAPFGVMKKPFTPAEILRSTDTFCKFARSRLLTSKPEEVLS